MSSSKQEPATDPRWGILVIVVGGLAIVGAGSALSEIRRDAATLDTRAALSPSASKPAVTNQRSQGDLDVAQRTPPASGPEESAPTPPLQAANRPISLPPHRIFLPPSSENELRDWLTCSAANVDLETVTGASRVVRSHSINSWLLDKETFEAERRDVRNPLPTLRPQLDLMARRPDLLGLPVRQPPLCQVDEKVCENMRLLPPLLREFLADYDACRTPRRLAELEKKRIPESWIASIWSQPESISTLVQILQVEEQPTRLLLVRLLREIKGPEASAALAQQALFDLSKEVRTEATRALTARNRDEFRPSLLRGLRHIWPPVADHAAEALVFLLDTAAIPDLIDLLDLPDPGAPRLENVQQQWVVSELVRINHLRNCLLCHPASYTATDPVRGLVPRSDMPIHSALPLYYNRDQNQEGHFVRADVAYLKQDFSVMHVVPDHGVWPEMQRFDYLVRRRNLTPEEAKRWQRERLASYPQRQAVLFTLRELTGMYAGPASADWRRWERKRTGPMTDNQ